jgi:hypothetical protein
MMNFLNKLSRSNFNKKSQNIFFCVSGRVHHRLVWCTKVLKPKSVFTVHSVRSLTGLVWFDLVHRRPTRMKSCSVHDSGS